METKKNIKKKQGRQYFLVLVPHQETRVKIQRHFGKLSEKLRNALIENGFAGVYDFPFVSVLASLSQPLKQNELRTASHLLREAAGAGKITTSDFCIMDFPVNTDNTALFGPRLSLNLQKIITNSAEQKIKSLFSPLIIGACFLPEKSDQRLCETVSLCGSLLNTQLSFRAAAVANMYWQPVRINGEVCYKWKIGKLSWLPKADKAA